MQAQQRRPLHFWGARAEGLLRFVCGFVCRPALLTQEPALFLHDNVTSFVYRKERVSVEVGGGYFCLCLNSFVLAWHCEVLLAASVVVAHKLPVLLIAFLERRDVEKRGVAFLKG